MSNAIIVPDTFSGPVAAVFQGQQAGDDLSAGVGGGYGLIKYRGKVWSIQYQGNSMNLMRDDGDGPKGTIEVVIVKANPALSKTYYINGWDENSNSPPDCASANGITPDQGVPHKQADVCAMCPKNAWGSAPGGGKGKACGDHRRMAVVPMTDLRNESLGGPMLLRCPAASLQDLAAFNARYQQLGYPYFSMAIKIGFDATESFPKFTFAAIRPLTNEEAAIIVELQHSPNLGRVVSESNTPAVAQVAKTEGPAFLEPPPANAVAPVAAQVSPQPVSAPTPAPAPAVAQPTATVASAGNPAPAGANAPAVAPAPAPAAAPAAVTGFGATQPAGGQVAAPAAAQPAREVKMTGFGAATPEGNAAATTATPAAPAAQPAPAPAPAPSPGTVSAFEGSIDERLAALLATPTAAPAAPQG